MKVGVLDLKLLKVGIGIERYLWYAFLKFRDISRYFSTLTGCVTIPSMATRGRRLQLLQLKEKMSRISHKDRENTNKTLSKIKRHPTYSKMCI